MLLYSVSPCRLESSRANDRSPPNVFESLTVAIKETEVDSDKVAIVREKNRGSNGEQREIESAAQNGGK